MGTRALEIVRYNKRYYIKYHREDGYCRELGTKIVNRIPTDTKAYQEWLQRMREKYAKHERYLEKHIYSRYGESDAEQDHTDFCNFCVLPSVLPQLQQLDFEYCYILNLDCEVFTVNFGAHWKLSSIPRDDVWRRAMANSIYPYKPTISPDICPEEMMASPALDFPQRDGELGHGSRIVEPMTEIKNPGQAFLVRMLTQVVLKHNREIINFGREWSPSSFPFRELMFAIVSVASGQASFHSFAAQHCNPQTCIAWDCKMPHLPEVIGWFDKEWAGDRAPLLEFGSMCHRPGEAAGVSPSETTYWLEGVLVSLVPVIDDEAIGEAVAWGIEQGHDSFQVAVLSLFEVVLAEVSCLGTTGDPFITYTEPVNLSPLDPDYCMSTHPRERPERKPGMEVQKVWGELLMRSNCTGTMTRIRALFPGLCALVNFFHVASSRRAAAKSADVFPPEIYSRILDFVDHDTWKSCCVVSPTFRHLALSEYRLDDTRGIASGPFVRRQQSFFQQERPGELLLSFNFKNMRTGDVVPMMEFPNEKSVKECNWMPIIGGLRKALMVNVMVQFEPADNVPIETD
ncbi:hypothetical protein ACHAPT_009759 [Fusarium lateritium]